MNVNSHPIAAILARLGQENAADLCRKAQEDVYTTTEVEGMHLYWEFKVLRLVLTDREQNRLLEAAVALNGDLVLLLPGCRYGPQLATWREENNEGRKNVCSLIEWSRLCLDHHRSGEHAASGLSVSEEDLRRTEHLLRACTQVLARRQRKAAAAA